MRPYPPRLLPTIRAAVERDLLAFAREILDFNVLTDDLHGPLAQFLMRPGKRKLILGPRFCYKTTLCTIAYPMWRVLPRLTADATTPTGPGLRILIDSDLRANAKKMMGLIRTHFEGNVRLRQLWGDLRRDPGWTDEFFTLQRERDYVEPTFMSAGIDQVTVGLHFDLTVGDDLVNNTNVKTKEQLDKTSEHRRLLAPIIGDGDLVLVGCRWDDNDEYGRILRDATGGAKLVDVIKELRLRGELILGEWQVFFRTWQHPDETQLIPMYTPAFIATQKRDLGGYFFSANFENDPVPQEFATFKREWLERYWTHPLPDGLRVTMTVDPAVSEERWAAYSAITAVGFDSVSQRRYSLRAWRGKVSEVELIRQLFTIYEELLAQELAPQVLGFEDVALQRIYRTIIHAEEERRGYQLPLRMLRRDPRRTKHLHIGALVPTMEEGLWFFRPDQDELIDELLRYPKGRSNDLIDSLAYHLVLQQAFSRLVYPMFDLERHVNRARPERFDRVAVGLYRTSAGDDFGVAVLGRQMRVWYVLEEALIPRATTVPDLVGQLYGPREQYRAFGAGSRIYVAPHEAALRDELIRNRFPVRFARGYADPAAPAARLATLLDRDRFVVGPHLPNLIREFGLFSWPDKPQGLVRMPDMQHGRIIGACQLVVWTEDPPERLPWLKRPVDPVDAELAKEEAARAAAAEERPYVTGYGWQGRR